MRHSMLNKSNSSGHLRPFNPNRKPNISYENVAEIDSRAAAAVYRGERACASAK